MNFSPSPPSPPTRGGESFLSFGYLDIGIYLGFGVWNLEFEMNHFAIIICSGSPGSGLSPGPQLKWGSLHRRRSSYPGSIHLY